MSRRLVLALLALSLVLPSTLATGAVALDQNPSPIGEPHSAALSAAQSGANETGVENGTTTATPTTTTAPANGSDDPAADGAGRPDLAATARILPIQFEADFITTSTVDQGEQYNTSGPFALWSVSSEIEAAAVQQPGATATVLDGGNVVKVEYDQDAAPVGQASLYELELYFSDDSSRVLELYARNTDVDVGNRQMTRYRTFVMDVLNDAESAGYDRSPEGAQSHYEDVKADAQLLDSLFTERAKRFIGNIIGILTNPLGIAAILLSAAGISAYLLWSNRQVLEWLSTGTSKTKQLRERYWIQYEKHKQTAAEEHLREVVGESNEIYWSDAFDVDTVAGLAELFRTGVAVRRDGEIAHVGGVDELEAETIASSWLEPVTREHRLPSPEIALTDGKKALHRMITEYGMGHIYGDAHERVVELIDELDESREITRYAERSRDLDGPAGGAAVPGGDD